MAFVRHLPSAMRFAYGLGLLVVWYMYTIRYPGPAQDGPYPVPGVEPSSPSFLLSIAIAGGVMMVAATISEFVPNRVGTTLSYVAAAVGAFAVFHQLVPPLLAPAGRPGFERIAGVLPWVMTMASVFLAMLPREIAKGDGKAPGSVPRRAGEQDDEV